MDKKGQGMSITVIILLVLGIAILVLVIIGFAIGWGNLAEKFNIFTPSTNIDDLVQSCNLVVTQPGAYCEFKLVNLDGKKQYVNCEDSRITAKLQTGAPPTCDVTPAQFCTGKPATTLVNGQACSKLNPAAYASAPATTTSTKPTAAMQATAKVLSNLAKSNSYGNLIKTYLAAGRIDLPLLLDNYLRAEYGIYNNNKVFKDYDAFYKYRKGFIENLKAAVSVNSVSYAYLIKDKSYELLKITNYNRGFSNVVEPFAEKRIQCQSATRLFVTSALEILEPAVSEKLLIIYTSGHTLPGYIDEDGKLIGIEATAEGKSLVVFGKVKADKSLEGQTEHIVAMRADYELFYGILTDENLKNEVREKGIVVNNKGKEIDEASGQGAGGSTAISSIPSNAFGSVNVPAGDIKIGRIDTTSQFTGMSTYSANIAGREGGALTAPGTAAGTGTTSARQEHVSTYSVAKTNEEITMLDNYYALVKRMIWYQDEQRKIINDQALSSRTRYDKAKALFDKMDAEWNSLNGDNLVANFAKFLKNNNLEIEMTSDAGAYYNSMSNNLAILKKRAGL